MARLAEDNHIIILETLITKLKGIEILPSVEGERAQQICQDIEKDGQLILGQMVDRLQEFEHHWNQLFVLEEIGMVFEKNKLLTHTESGWGLPTITTPEGLRLYFQLTVRDMLVEGARIFALFLGTISRFQERWGKKWHETEFENAQKLLPLFESTLRNGEMLFFKQIHQSIPRILGTGYQNALTVDKVIYYHDRLEAIRYSAWPWYQPGTNESGMQGYMLGFSDFLKTLMEEIMYWYQRKWRLYLMGQSELVGEKLSEGKHV